MDYKNLIEHADKLNKKFQDRGEPSNFTVCDGKVGEWRMLPYIGSTCFYCPDAFQPDFMKVKK